MFVFQAYFPIIFVDNPYSKELQNELIRVPLIDKNSLLNTINELEHSLRDNNYMMNFSDIEIEVDKSTFSNPAVSFSLLQEEADTDKIFIVENEQGRVILHHTSIPDFIIESLFSPSIRTSSTALFPLHFEPQGDCTMYVYEYWLDQEVRKSLVATLEVILPKIDKESLLMTEMGSITTRYSQ